MPQPHDRELSHFAPRVTVMLICGFLLFLASALLYSLPVMLEPPPPGAIADWHREQVQAHLQGKVFYFLVPSFVVAALLGAWGYLPFTRRR